MRVVARDLSLVVVGDRLSVAKSTLILTQNDALTEHRVGAGLFNQLLKARPVILSVGVSISALTVVVCGRAAILARLSSVPVLASIVRRSAAVDGTAAAIVAVVATTVRAITLAVGTASVLTAIAAIVVLTVWITVVAVRVATSVTIVTV